jgi:hypothetical protein
MQNYFLCKKGGLKVNFFFGGKFFMNVFIQIKNKNINEISIKQQQKPQSH